MRGLLVGIVFLSLLPLIFIKGPFVGVLMWFWVSLMAPQFVVWTSVFAVIPYALVAAVATFASWLLFSGEPKLPPRDKTSVLLFFLMIWVSITSYFGTGPPDEIRQSWLLTEKMLLMTLVAYALTYGRGRVDPLIAVCAFSVAVYGVKGGAFALLHGGAYRVFGPGKSMIGDNNELGVALTMMLPLLFYLRRRYCPPYLRRPMWGLIGLALIGDLFTYSRGALLAIGAAAAVAALRSRHKLASPILAIAVAAGAWYFAPAQWSGRMNTINTYQQDASAESRLYMWRLDWVMALRHPILGSGFHWSFAPASVNRELAGQGFHWSFGDEPTISETNSDGDRPPLISPRDSHSIWFGMLSSQGFPGLLLFVGILIGAMIDARWLVRTARRRPELAWADDLGRMLQASLVGFAVGGTFASLEYYDGFYAVVIIAAAARRAVASDGAAPARREPTTAPALRTTSVLQPQPAGVRPVEGRRARDCEAMTLPAADR